ncbi:hypothetical protein [Methanofollis ethanolicus]|uniref:hypothetical protein n=1 Tax=Methanofollis ethanolicus TaxID=488124 RepID=UPI00083440D9|nr:hypothetical protein [Methanofollis ethanolicus]
MVGENEENSPGEKEKSQEKSQEKSGRVAHCLNCTNEWIPRDQADKKRKCPVCGKYRVVWKDDLPENKPDSSTSPGEKKEKSGENEENSPGEKEKREEKTEEKSEVPEDDEFLLISPGENEEKNKEEKLQEAMKKVGGIPPLAVVGIIAVLGVLAFFLWFLPGRTHRKDRQQTPAAPPISGRVQNAMRRLY